VAATQTCGTHAEVNSKLYLEDFPMQLKLAPSLTPEPTLAAVAEEWLAAIRGTVRPHTLTHYRGHLARYWLPLLGDVPVAELTRRRIREAMSALLERPLAPQTVAVAHSILHMVLAFAVDDELLEVNVATGLARRLHRPLRRRTTLDIRQLNLFLETAAKVAPREYPLFVALASGGLRIGEVLGLRAEDVALDQPVLHIRRNIRMGGIEGEPKTGKSRRSVRLTENAASVLREVRVGETGWLFPGRNPAKPISYTTIATLTMRIAMRAGLPPLTPKTFRRSFAAVMKRAGVGVTWVCDQLGHSSVKVTERFYIDGTPPPPVPDILLARR
jgi:integrase